MSTAWECKIICPDAGAGAGVTPHSVLYTTVIIPFPDKWLEKLGAPHRSMLQEQGEDIEGSKLCSRGNHSGFNRGGLETSSQLSTHSPLSTQIPPPGAYLPFCPYPCSDLMYLLPVSRLQPRGPSVDLFLPFPSLGTFVLVLSWGWNTHTSPDLPIHDVLSLYSNLSSSHTVTRCLFLHIK